MGEDFYKMIKTSTITFPGLTKVDFFFPGFLWVERSGYPLSSSKSKKKKKGKTKKIFHHRGIQITSL